MAWDGHGEPVRAAGPSDRARGSRLADGRCDFGVAHGLAGWNPAEGIPHPALEDGAADVEEQVDRVPGIVDKPDHLRDGRLELRIGADQLGLRKLVLKVAGELIGIVAEEIAQTPLAVAATRMAPSEHSPTANRIEVPCPPSRYWPGRMPSCCGASS